MLWATIPRARTRRPKATLCQRKSRWRRRGRAVRFESLESRQLLSVSPLPEEILWTDPAGTEIGQEDDSGVLDPGANSSGADTDTLEAFILGTTVGSTEQATGLARFASEADLERHLIEDALERYRDLFGKPGYWGPVWALDNNGTSGGQSRPAETKLDHSETNTQVAGVDEGDIVETDGDYLYVLSGQELVILDSWPAENLHVASRMTLDGQPLAEYLQGDRLTVISELANVWLADSATQSVVRLGPPVGYVEPRVKVTVLDVSDRGAPRVVQATEMEGTLVDSRAVEDHVYLVLRHGFVLPGPELLPAGDDGTVPPPPGDGGVKPVLVQVGDAWQSIWYPPEGKSYVYETQEQYLARVAGRAPDLALPHCTSYAADGSLVESGLLSEPTDIYQPRGPEDTNLMSVVVFDASSDTPGPVSSTSVPAQDVWQVYASHSSIYLLESVWALEGAKTAILKLDRDATGQRVDLSAIGAVPGRIVNQFSVDEHHGYLRIATTDGWGQTASSGVYVLEQDGEALAIAGSLEGLATGEQIYSVRFLEDLAFVVTFRRIDPLWTIDLSNPEDPRVAGDLEIPGFSNYLHQIPGGYLIGIGRDADPTTGAWQAPQVSLFDVADVAEPLLLDRFTIDVGPWGWSEAFGDHHAVGYYPEYQVLAISVTASGRSVVAPDGATNYLAPETDLWVFKIDVPADPQAGAREGAIRLLGRVQHDAPIRRTVQIENLLYSISADTVSVHDILRPESEIVRTYYGDRMTPLGPVDSRQVSDLGFAPADPWYALEATRKGLLTVEGACPAGLNQVNMTLYDEYFRPLATSSRVDAGQRIDWQTAAGTKYYVRVSQVAGAGSPDAPFTLRLSNLVRRSGKQWTVYGTDGDDRFALDTSAGRLEVKGVRYPFQRSQLASVTFDGGKGNDTYRLAARSTTVRIVDRAGVDQLDFSQAAAGLKLDLNRTDGKLQQIGAGGNSLGIRGVIENVIGTRFADTIWGNSAANRIGGGPGNDWLYGGSGDDRLIGGPGDDHLCGESGNDILEGGYGNDWLYGGDGNDLLVGGRGADYLSGDVGDDVIISKAIRHPANADRLDRILGIWNSPAAYGVRTDSIRSLFLAEKMTLFSDGAKDQLKRGPGRDWFFTNLGWAW